MKKSKKILWCLGCGLTLVMALTLALSACPSPTGGSDSFIAMVNIPGGKFIMGSPASEPKRISPDENQNPETVSAFSMGKYPVTQAQWFEVMGTTIEEQYGGSPPYGKGNNNPMFCINWFEAVIFCNKLSIKEGLDPVYEMPSYGTDPDEWMSAVPMPTNYDGSSWYSITMNETKNGYRLPTSAEWEYACRGKYQNKATEYNTKPFGIGDGTKIISGMATFNYEYLYDLAKGGEYIDPFHPNSSGPTAVGMYKPNNYGLYDMHGNVFEWCWDKVYADFRKIRGGWALSTGSQCRSAYSTSKGMYTRDLDVGFRVVRSQ